MGKINLRPNQFRGLFGGDVDGVFLLITSPRIHAHVEVHPDPGVWVSEFIWQGGRSAEDLLGRLACYSRAGHKLCALWMAEAPPLDLPTSLLNDIKLGALFGLELIASEAALKQLIEIVSSMDQYREEAIERALLSQLDAGLRITLESKAHQTSAVFYHRAVEQWRSLHGSLQYGEQTLLPTGELSAVINDPEVLEGELVLTAHPVITRGRPGVSFESANTLYQDLASAGDHAVIATIEEGRIEYLRDPKGAENPLLERLEALFEKDQRYRRVHRISFGTNRALEAPAPGNFPANRRVPGVHIGLGEPERTELLIDMICTEIDALVEHQEDGALDLYEELFDPSF